MLALHPGLVQVELAEPPLADELRAVSAARGHEHLERFVDGVVRELRPGAG
jgi:hypothetical protein